LPDGRSIPVSMKGGTGGGNTYNIDARGADVGVVDRIKQALAIMDKSIETRAVNAVQNTMKRNPSYGRGT